tara:strand:- start:652 stop:762 length:111 start_codon:yes stop_codon:yes gene_type:complete
LQVVVEVELDVVVLVVEELVVFFVNKLLFVDLQVIQ